MDFGDEVDPNRLREKERIRRLGKKSRRRDLVFKTKERRKKRKEEEYGEKLTC
jgi:hypothetical protein